MSTLARPRGSVLLTGGAGYIGAQTARALDEAGWRPVTFDNLSFGNREMVRWGDFIHGDIRDRAAVREALERHRVEAVIHLAGLKDVALSVTRPDLFYDHNVAGTACLLAAMRESGVSRLVLSSSAAVYGHSTGAAADGLIAEDAPKAPASPYGETKLAAERMIEAYCRAFDISAVALRYFNAAGADSAGRTGELRRDATHLIPRLIDASLGEAPPITLFGDDYDTPDGSCIRDYVHIGDLARAHVAALDAPALAGRFEAFNVGAGVGHSVLEVIRAAGRVLGRDVPFVVGARRPGDPAKLVADSTRLRAALPWTPQESRLESIVETAVRWRRGAVFQRLAVAAA